MTREQVHDLMENELRCVQRGNYCDRDCAKCPLVKDDKELIEAYGYVIKELEQEPIDYKTQYENYLKKSKVVISQLRADRDRLQDAFDKVRAEIKQYQSDYDVHGTEYDRTAWKAFNRCLKFIDKYKAESEE